MQVEYTGDDMPLSPPTINLYTHGTFASLKNGKLVEPTELHPEIGLFG